MKKSTLLFPLLAGCLLLPEEDPEPFSDCRADEGDPYTIETWEEDTEPVYISGDTLHVSVGHGGGCETHDYQICWSGMFMESEPVQVDLEVWHDANGDSCDAYLAEELTFDLTPLKQAWIDSYQADAGTITVHLGGHTVEYTFGP